MRVFKYFLVLVFFLNLNQIANSKPVPPGSGEGDVPANILILLDSSASMNNKIGGGNPRISSMTIDGNGNKVLSSVDKKRGGLYLFDSDGVRINFTGIKQTTNTSYTRDVWFTGGQTTATCDWRIGANTNISQNFNIGAYKRFHEVQYVSNVTVGGTNISGENLLFVGFYNEDRAPYIFALDEDYKCRLAITGNSIRNFRGFDIAFNSQAGGPAIYAYGMGGGGNKNAFMLTCNFTAGTCAQIQGRGKGRGDLYGRLWDGGRIRVTDNASEVYVSKSGWVFGYTNGAGVNALPANTNNPFRQCFANMDVFDIDENDDDIFYGGRWNDTRIDKHEWSSTRDCPVRVSAGTSGSLKNSGTAGGLNADSIRISRGVHGVRVVGNRLLYSNESHVDELNSTLFTSANRDTMWQNQVGGGDITRWTGAKEAISSLLTDSTLTSGANFGFGHWNAGEGNLGRKARPRGGAWCHSNGSMCTYYSGWIGDHTTGKSNQCTKNSCINVGISSEGAARTLPILASLGVEWGTDANSFSEMAHDYYFSGDNEAYDPNSDCQLNYIIVIGDGMMTNTGTQGQAGFAAQRIEQLRTTLGVKTLFVAYGGGIRARGMQLFDNLARIGSCDDANSTDCEPTIVADTPEQLKTQLQSKIRQILAERLAFTAPSITATIQEGGSLYQAQFAYEQFGEWQGTILKKALNPDGTVEHDADFPGNWDAAEKIKEQSTAAGSSDSRNIWTAMPEVSYIGNWDNFNTDTENLNGINNLFLRLGYQLDDYHNASSHCTGVGSNGTTDELEGLVNFMKGTDYFDYDGDCNITEVRDHVLGDIYHSQLIEIGSPDGSTQFTDNNQEAYFRTINNYQSFMATHNTRRNVLYAGSNSGMLHAINAETGREEWAFVPPFIAGKLPILINDELDGRVDGTKGGTNAIFGVDGSPVVHDVFMKGLTIDGQIEDGKSWHTLLFIPYGRGGAGFSVLDVTNPIVKAGKGPLHMFSVFNDYVNSVVYIADDEGSITEYEYFSSSASVEKSLEAQKADANLSQAIDDDGYDLFADPPVTTTTVQDSIAPCQSNADATSGTFFVDGTSSCYQGTTFTFDEISFPVADGTTISADQLTVSELIDGEFVPVPFSSARMINGRFEITFADAKTYNPGGGSTVEPANTNNFFIQSSCTVASGLPPTLDYSTLGETWSTPRIVRLPSDVPGEESQRANDKYVAIMGAGLANNNLCAGSSVFAIELDDMSHPARIYGGEINSGPMTIIDTDPSGVTIGNNVIPTANGSNINNAIPTTPIVITPDTAFGIPWRGAMVYVNDREGKITKINLTDSKKNNAQMFDQTTLFRLNASEQNKRYTFFGMDAGVGVDTKDFWLFGGTGDFGKLGDRSALMDNILYGIRDRDYPYFKHLNNVTIPKETDSNFRELAHTGANAAKSIDDLSVCSDVTGDASGDDCPSSEDGWVIYLNGTSINSDGTVGQGGEASYRKVSAPPTLFKGQVYFPVYEPPPGANRCNIGNAFICASDDECGTNNSHELVKGSAANAGACTFVREGVLSELVIFGDKLYANVAGPSDNPDTLYSILAIAGEVLSNKGGWRDTGF